MKNSTASPSVLDAMIGKNETSDPSQLFWKFHGPEGVVPLNRSDCAALSPAVCPIAAALATSCSARDAHEPPRCPVSGSTAPADQCPFAALHAGPSASGGPGLSAAPFASIGIRFPFDLFGGAGGRKPKPKKNPQGRDGGKARFRSNQSSTEHPTDTPSNAPSSSQSGSTGNNSTGAGAGAGPGAGAAGGGKCPMRRFYEPAVAALTAVGALGPKLQLQCPPAVVQARAVLARTPLFTSIRRQPLPAKLLCVGALSLLANVPLGALREHTEKFSLQWVAAVHASIPFVALLRKASLLPKYSVAVTIASAVAGQAIGAALERRRLAEGAEGVDGCKGQLPVAAEAKAVEGAAAADSASDSVRRSERRGAAQASGSGPGTGMPRRNAHASAQAQGLGLSPALGFVDVTVRC